MKKKGNLGKKLGNFKNYFCLLAKVDVKIYRKCNFFLHIAKTLIAAQNTGLDTQHVMWATPLKLKVKLPNRNIKHVLEN